MGQTKNVQGYLQTQIDISLHEEYACLTHVSYFVFQKLESPARTIQYISILLVMVHAILLTIALQICS